MALSSPSSFVSLPSFINPGRERRARTLELFAIWGAVIAVSWGGETGLRALSRHWEWDDRTFFVINAGFWWLYVAGFFALFNAITRRDWAARSQREATGDVVRLHPRASAGLSAGMHLTMFVWLIALAWNAHDPMTAEVVTGMMAGLAVWNYFKLRHLTGIAAAYASGRHYHLCSVFILVVLNLRLDFWLATRYEVSVAEIHQRFPMWLIPVLTLALMAWVALLVAGHRPKTPAGQTPTK
jgi:hypothetical protein